MGSAPLMRAMLSLRGLRRLRTLESAIGNGFVLMHDDPPRRLTLGLVGKPWRPSGHLQRLSPEQVTAFDEPGFVKVLWHFVVEESAGSTKVSTATEVYATDGEAAKLFGRYWRVVGPFSGMLRRSMLTSIKGCAEAR